MSHTVVDNMPAWSSPAEQHIIDSGHVSIYFSGSERGIADIAAAISVTIMTSTFGHLWSDSTTTRHSFIVQVVLPKQLHLKVFRKGTPYSHPDRIYVACSPRPALPLLSSHSKRRSPLDAGHRTQDLLGGSTHPWRHRQPYGVSSAKQQSYLPPHPTHPPPSTPPQYQTPTSSNGTSRSSAHPLHPHTPAASITAEYAYQPNIHSNPQTSASSPHQAGSKSTARSV
jgi:hypothetical protein